ncbi:hypothetical protein FB451DRAFT_1146128 [Mycena latifolia]|nr:hypothetical protein FB451DRAFT_1146128 [Mycena latifolia]
MATTRCWNCGLEATPPSPLVPARSPPGLTLLLTSNDTPEASQIPSIQEFISPRSLRLDLLNVQIEGLQTALTRLIHERDNLEEAVREHKGIISPVRRLPSELISHIIRLASPDIRQNVGGQEQEYLPWRFAHICGRWRACALAEARIWADIKASSYHPQASPLPMIQTQLLLSKDVPLEISFRWKSVIKKKALTHFLVVLNLVVNHSIRWAKVTLNGTGTRTIMPLSSALSRVKSQLPLLRTLEWVTAGNVDWFEDSPNLEEVFLTRPGIPFRDPDDSPTVPSQLTSIPWHQITKYRAIYKDSTHLDILRRAHSLREGGLYSLRPGIDLPNAEVVEARELRRLLAENWKFLDYLVAPMLEELFVFDSSHTILPFLLRSGAQLTSLTIFHWFPALDLAPVLRGIPSLIHLRVEIKERLYNHKKC